MPYVGYSSTLNQGSANGRAAVISAEGGYMVDASQANINNQQAYSMQLDNHLKKVDTFFEARQSNCFYRDLEQWQKKQRTEFKKYGIYDREAIRYIYGR
jgi:catabolite regulation protein CreA